MWAALYLPRTFPWWTLLCASGVVHVPNHLLGSAHVGVALSHVHWLGKGPQSSSKPLSLPGVWKLLPDVLGFVRVQHTVTGGGVGEIGVQLGSRAGFFFM